MDWQTRLWPPLSYINPCNNICSMVETTKTSCLPKPNLADRPLLTGKQVIELAGLFKVLANDTRLRLIHALVRSGEMRMTELALSLGMKPQAVSNQLQKLLDLGFLASRRQGANIYYRIVDPCVRSLLDHGLCLSEDAKARSR